jgi:benzoyl-CoA reductase/2-hydroxyglutaryl-CoA dehydratase subunit BcrC/BadD/HgdB
MFDDVMREVNALIRDPSNRHIEAWKAAGKPAIGYFCHYSPPELMLAAGALPVRLRAAGSDDSSLGDSLMSGRVCTYVRHVVSLALDGRYEFLDGEICLNCCDHVRRAADVFTKKSAVPFHGFVSVPRQPREGLFPYYRRELQRLFDQLTAHLGVAAGADEWRAAIRAMNETRARLAAINRLRLEDKPRLSGAEALAIHIASQVTPPAAFVELADRLLADLATRPGLDSSRGRLLLIGAELDEPAYVAAVESQGALVVADRLCFGARSVLAPIDENAPDPLDAIARAYFFQPSCARMIGDFPNRWADLRQAVAETRADGVVFTRLVFCDPWGAEIHNLNGRVRGADGFPMLSLSREYGIVPTGQIKTRVQAFVEKLEIARLQRRAAGGAA